MATTISMPSLGESIVEGTIGKWLVNEGDRVEKDQVVVEVESDKANTEVRAPEAGVVSKFHVKQGEIVSVGGKLFDLDPSGAGASAGAGAAGNGNGKKAARKSNPPEAPAKPAAPSTASGSTGPSVGVASPPPPPVMASPAVRKMAREHGVDPAAVAGSGPSGRITREDVMRSTQSSGGAAAAQELRAASPAPASPVAGGKQGGFQVPAYQQKPGDEIIPFSRRRRIIADHMVYSKLTSPHVVTVAECDLHRTSKLRDKHKDVLKKQGVNLTFLAFVASATCRALRENRSLNARVLEDAYVLLRDINLGIAVDTPDGLVVPVVRNADELSVRGIARAIDELALKARDGKLTPDDLAQKTFTISNPGRKGNLFGGAIISQPNVGILRIGEISKRVVVVEQEDEDVMAIHPVMYMALSYDHRIVDGVAANSFLWRVVEILESGDFEV